MNLNLDLTKILIPVLVFSLSMSVACLPHTSGLHLAVAEPINLNSGAIWLPLFQ